MKSLIALALAATCVAGCAHRESSTETDARTVRVSNLTASGWKEAPAVVADRGVVEAFGVNAALVGDDAMWPVQVVDLDGNGTGDEAWFLADLAAGEAKELRVAEVATFAPLEPRAHTGMYLKGFEGPGWESDALAFRIYWDARNATDIFCKRAPVLGLKHYATPGTNYHQDTPWGMDVLKVGTALGIGGFGVWQDGKVEKVADATRDFKVVADGPLCAVADLIYTDWKVGARTYDLTVRMRMVAGQRFCESEMWLVPKDGGAIPDLVAGIVKHPDTTLVRDDKAGILGRFGVQALGPGEALHSAKLGLGIAFDPDDLAAIGEDDVNTFVRLRPERTEPPVGMAGNGGRAAYRINASWEHEPAGAQSAAEYEAILRGVAALRPNVSIH